MINIVPVRCGKKYFRPSVDDQAVSLSDDGTTIIIDFFSFFSLSSFSPPPSLFFQKGLS